MIRKRAELDLDNPPGQVVNPTPRELTIGGIVDRIMKDEPKKLTIDELGMHSAAVKLVQQLGYLWAGGEWRPTAQHDELLQLYKNALWKACGDNEETVNDYLESQR